MAGKSAGYSFVTQLIMLKFLSCVGNVDCGY